MSLWSRARELAGSGVETVGRGARRARLEVKRRRLRSRISNEQAELGRLLQPLIVAKTIDLESSEVQAIADRINALQAELEQLEVNE